MHRFNKYLRTLLLFLSMLGLMSTNVGAQEQVIDASGFSVTTQLPETAPKVPEGKHYVAVNNNIPYFTNEDITALDPWIEFTHLDAYGRVGAANALLNEDLLPAQVRQSNSQIEPTGWQQAKYRNEWLYNRCHLIGYQLIGDGRPELNLMTGTRQFNVNGMVPFENTVARAIESGLTVRYRVTPFFEYGNLLASGVFMEAFSIEDNGATVQMNVYVPNVQEGISIDYGTGANSNTQQLAQSIRQAIPLQTETELYYSYNRDGAIGDREQMLETPPATDEAKQSASTIAETPQEARYIANMNTMKFHYAHCDSVKQMAEHNKLPMDNYDELIARGYVPCKRCNPR